MCSLTPPVKDFGINIFEDICNQRFEEIQDKIKNFKKKGFKISFYKISYDKYNTLDFKTKATKMFTDSKKQSKGYYYNGIIVMFPFIKKYDDKLFISKPNTIYYHTWDLLFRLSCEINDNLCLNNMFFNVKMKKRIENKDIYLMIFYHKNGLVKNY